MRLSPESIQSLAVAICESLQAEPDLELKIGAEELTRAIASVITEDLKAEDDLEAEARATLEDHREMIRRRGANFDEMLRMTIKKMARERKMVL